MGSSSGITRDFARIHDNVSGIISTLDNALEIAQDLVLNIDDNRPVDPIDMMSTLEIALDRTAEKIMRLMQPSDVLATYADISQLNALTGYHSKVMLKYGLQRFVDCYDNYAAAARHGERLGGLRNTRSIIPSEDARRPTLKLTWTHSASPAWIELGGGPDE